MSPSAPAHRRGSRSARKVAWTLMKTGLRPQARGPDLGLPRVYDRRAIRRLAAWQATLLEYQDVGVLAMLQGIRACASGTSRSACCQGGEAVRHGCFHSWTSVIYYMSHTLLLGFTKRGTTHHQSP